MAKRYGGHTYSLAKKETLTLTRTHVNVAIQPTGPPTNPPPAPNRKSRPGGDWKGWYDSRAHINSRFAITLPTLVIPKGEKKATGTIILTPMDNGIRGFYNTYDDFTIPIDNDPDHSVYTDGSYVRIGGRWHLFVFQRGVRDSMLVNDYTVRRHYYPKRYPDLIIKIEGLAGSTEVDTTDIRVIDDEKLSSRLNLSFSPASLSKDAGPTPVTVTAALDGATLPSDQTFTLVFGTANDVTAHPLAYGFRGFLSQSISNFLLVFVQPIS